MQMTFAALRDHILSTIADATRLYFLPLRGWRPLVQELSHAPLATTPPEALVPASAIAILRDAVCMNQGALSEYWYQSAEKHKQLRKAFDSAPRNDMEISALAKELVNELNENLFKAARRNFVLMHEFFDARGEIPPRICIKGYFKTSEEGKVVTVFRDSPALEEPDTPSRSNTGFQRVIETGRYYLCNDLRKAAFAGHYKNPRLDMNRIATDRSRWLANRSNWDRYWLDHAKESHYRSTMIVPMTFWNNEFDSNFVRALDALPHSKRTIFGFLCLDHPKPNYFKEELDVSFGYVFADFISMFLFSRSVFIEISETFKKVTDYLKAPPPFDEDYAKIFASISKATAHMSRLRSVRDIEESNMSENHVRKLDHELLKFVSALQGIERKEANTVQ